MNPEEHAKTEVDKPVFMPEGVDFDALPEQVRHAIHEIVSPVYQELVLGSELALERSMGMSLVFMLVQEIFEQFALGQPFLASNASDETVAGNRAAREKQMGRLLKLVNAKQQAATFLLKMRRASCLYMKIKS